MTCELPRSYRLSMSSSDRKSKGANRIASAILLVATAGAPLPFGSRDMTTVALWCFLLGVGLIFASPRHLLPHHKVLLAGVAVLALCFAFVLHEQLSEHPWIAQPHQIWAKASTLMSKPLVPVVSILRGEPFYALGPSLAAMPALILGLVIGAEPARARQALMVFGWSAVGYALYGIGSLLYGQIAAGTSTSLDGNLTSTFINRNTAAAYFGSAAAVWLMLVLSKLRGRLPRGPVVWAEMPKHLFADGSVERELIVRFCSFFICLAAMFMTGSRAGVFVSLFVMSLAFVVFFRRDLPRGKGLVIAAFGAAAGALILLQVLGGNVEGRIDIVGLTDPARAEAWRSTLRMIGDHPWFGTGLGTFAWAFPSYRSANISILGVWDLAHSTPLELAAELGIPLTALITAGWIAAFIVLFRGSSRSRRRTVAPLAAFAAALIANVHSAVDFSLQVPGYAIVIFAITGVGLAQSFNSVTPGRRRRSRSASVQEPELRKANGGAVVELSPPS